MRVYELAKKLQTTSSELLRRAGEMDIEVYSAISSLEVAEEYELTKALQKRTPEQIAKENEALAQSRARKAAKVKAVREQELSGSREELEATRQRALKMYEDAHRKPAPVEVEPPAAPTPPAPPAATVETPTPPPPPPEPAEQPAVVAPPAETKTEKPRRAEKAPAAQQKAKPAEKTPGASKTSGKDRVPAKPARAHYEDEDEEELNNIRLRPSDRENLRSTQKTQNRANAQTRDRGNQNTGRNGQRGDRNDRNERNDRNDRNDKRFQRSIGGREDGGRMPNRGAPAAATGEPSASGNTITLRGAIVVKDLAEKLGLRPNRLIADLMQLNILASINQHVELDVATKIAGKYGFTVELEKAKRSTERKPVLKSEDADDEIPEDKPEDLVARPPVVTFLGHVDHGKTSLMDYIRKTKVAAGEAGGITQHIAAYSVDINGNKITFLDTPGHAAFSAMRVRGAQLTDIAVIIIAADDGVMPQTREAIAAARQAGVQIMVAVNKCDLPTANPDRVRQMLQREGLTTEDWGGDIICCNVSAHTGQGVEDLLENILVQAEMLELRANPNRRADGYVIEAQLEQGLGPTATVLVTGGTLKVGDIILCGEHFGKIRGLIDDRGCRVKSAGPSAAVRCMGLSGVPEAGARFRVMLNEKRARELAAREADNRKLAQLSTAKATSLDALMRQMSDSDKRSLSVIVKADTQGSSEAVCDELRAIASEKVSLEIVSESIGNVSATDVSAAAASKAIIVGFNTGCESGVQQQARHDGVRINNFRIIYELLEHVKKCMLDLLPPEYKEVVKGHAEIKAIFDIGKTGRVAGCQLTDGMLLAKGFYRIFRKKELLWTGKLSSLKHFQNEVSEVTGAQECGIHFAGYEEFQAGDTIECYVLEELPRTL